MSRAETSSVTWKARQSQTVALVYLMICSCKQPGSSFVCMISRLAQGHEIVAHHELGPHNTIFHENRVVGLIDWDDAAPGRRLRDLANAVYCYVDVSHWANQTADEQARRIHLMYTAYGWGDPIAIVNDFEADLQQALGNHEQAGRTGAVKVFQEEVNWMRLRAQELRLALR
jgi:thiamine kinase-like enzyme